MTKSELVELLESLHIACNEGQSTKKNTDIYPRIVFWDYAWEDVMASGGDYATVETYQISFFAREPRHPKLLELREALRKEGMHPMISHEYVQTDKVFHSFMAVEVYV
jgi:hypothetical protein